MGTIEEELGGEMFETYRIMSAKLNKELDKWSMEELCDMYGDLQAKIEPYYAKKKEWINNFKQEHPNEEVPDYNTIDPISGIEKDLKLRDEIFRALYCRLFPMMLTIQKNYPTLSNAQRVEVTMMILVSTLRCYKSSKQKTKFSTYYFNNLKNGMMTQINSMKCNKRSAMLYTIQDQEKVTLILQNQKNRPVENSIDYFMDNLQTSISLSTLEKDYCNFVLSGYTKTCQDRGKIDKLYEQYDMTHDLGEKEKILTKINNEKNKPTTDEIRKVVGTNTITNPMLKDGDVNKLLKQAKKSLKEKIELFDRELFY